MYIGVNLYSVLFELGEEMVRSTCDLFPANKIFTTKKNKDLEGKDIYFVWKSLEIPSILQIILWTFYDKFMILPMVGQLHR